MTLKPLSTDQQIVNCVLALWRWKDVPAKHVCLESWGCNTHACFGGHLQTWPEFQAQGMEIDEDYRFPWIPGWDYGDGYLFGDETMFDGRGGGGTAESFLCASEVRGLSDHDIVTLRLHARLSVLLGADTP